MWLNPSDAKKINENRELLPMLKKYRSATGEQFPAFSYAKYGTVDEWFAALKAAVEKLSQNGA